MSLTDESLLRAKTANFNGEVSFEGCPTFAFYHCGNGCYCWVQLVAAGDVEWAAVG